MELATNNNCPREEIAAYLDDELSGATLTGFETHLENCSDCATELRGQRQLLCTLDVAFNQPQSFELPSDFTHVIATRAESDLRGVRRKGERRRAVKVCAILAIFSFALIGTAWRAVLLEPIRSFARVAESFLDLAWRTTYDAGTGVAVIVRVVSRAAVTGRYGLGILLTAFVISISLLPLLIARYHRTQIIE
jgi:Putative zinc-finger